MTGVRALADQAFSRAAGTSLLENNRIRLLEDAKENYPACSIPSGATKPYIRYERRSPAPAHPCAANARVISSPMPDAPAVTKTR
jgi:hypothetical protein